MTRGVINERRCATARTPHDPKPYDPKGAARLEMEGLSRLERFRRLSEGESLRLERCICILDDRPFPHGLTRALARYGIKRDMRRFG